MNKRDAKIQAYLLCAKAIEEFVGDGSLDMHNEFETESEQLKVEREMYGIANSLRDKYERLSGDDGEE